MGIVGFDFLEGPIKEEDRQLYGFDYLQTHIWTRVKFWNRTQVHPNYHLCWIMHPITYLDALSKRDNSNALPFLGLVYLIV